MRKWIRIVLSILSLNIAIAFSWSAAYTIVSYVAEKQNESDALTILEHDARMIADTTGAAHPFGNDEWKAIAESSGYRLIIIDEAGKQISYGKKAEQFPQTMDERDVRAVLGGGIAEHIKRPNPFKPGIATVGLPFNAGGKRLALFIQSETPGLYSHFGRQVVIQIVGFIIMVLLILCIRPWRKDLEGWVQVIEAIRRIAKGDFKVVIQTGKNVPGQFEQLVSSINDMAVELNQMEQMRQTFISNVSHEIQSPLTSIQGFARALQQEGLEYEQRKHYYGIIETESTRLSKLSDNLLKLTSLESDQHPFEPKRYRLDRQLRSMILACEPQWVEKDILMDVELAETTVEADEDLLSQVWMNLLSNSIKFTPNGGTISIEAKPAEDGATVRISDNGTGISEEDLPHIFERFFKADKSRNRMLGGSGLGLSIVKRILDMHGGDVQVSSTRGVGTTFTVNLPHRKEVKKPQ
jgi:signal transduction histidine kinase